MKKNIYIGFDLDETLIASVEEVKEKPENNYDFYIKDNEKVYFGTYIRQGAKDLLSYIDENYQLFFYTRAPKEYANAVILNLGYGHIPLFYRRDTDTESFLEKSKYEEMTPSTHPIRIKRLDKIAKKLNTSLENIVFIDDIRNVREIRPIQNVLKSSGITPNNLDNKEFFDFLIYLKSISHEPDLVFKNKFLQYKFDDSYQIESFLSLKDEENKSKIVKPKFF